MSEPSLENISDYKTLDAEKKRTLLAIVFAILVMGIIYTIVANIYGTVDDEIQVEEKIKSMPLR